MGRQPYHGARELVLSNAMDIIDAQTIACAAEVSQWNENDDDSDSKLQERFWRQTFDITKLDPRRRKGGLSELRKHCICHDYYNPDRTLYKCRQAGCGIWNHEECLEDAVMHKVLEHLEKGTLDEEIRRAQEKVDHHETFGEKIHHMEKKIAKVVMREAVAVLDTVAEQSLPEVHATVKAKQHTHDKDRKAWEGRFDIAFSATDEESVKNGGVKAHITELAKAGKGKEKTAPRQWTIIPDCLKCGEPLE